MRVRRVDAQGDYVFGGDQAAFLKDTPAAVAQIVESRLHLWTNEWYLDLAEGTPYSTDVFGFRTDGLRDAVIQARILSTPGVRDIAAYSSSLDRQTRSFTPTGTINTVYGSVTGSQAAITVRLPVEEDR